MNNPLSSFVPPSDADLAELSDRIYALATTYTGDSEKLLALLRLLECLHRDIREEQFQASLPNNRQALYNLLRVIETEGGWPYIPRMKLRAFLAAVAQDPNQTSDQTLPEAQTDSDQAR